MGKAFFDTNVLLYLLSEDAIKADRAEVVMVDGGVISVQVLNEFASVATRKLRMTYHEVRDALAPLRELCTVEPLTSEIHDLGLNVAERFGFSLYDALIVASALSAGCDTLYSEDFQDGQRIDGRLVIRNPFRCESFPGQPANPEGYGASGAGGDRPGRPPADYRVK